MRGEGNKRATRLRARKGGGKTRRDTEIGKHRRKERENEGEKEKEKEKRMREQEGTEEEKKRQKT